MADVKEGRLLMKWSKRDNDFVYYYPENGKVDGGMLHFYATHVRDPSEEYFEKYGRGGMLGNADYPGRTLIDQLKARGYDITTLRIQCDRKTDDK